MEQQLELKNFLKHFLPVFLVSAFAASAILASFHTSYTRAEKKLLETSETHLVDFRAEIMERDFQAIRSDLLYLAHPLTSYLKNETAPARDALAQDFLSFCRRKGIYDQIRWLNQEGMEIVRVNFNNGQPAIVAYELLQAKQSRYYFAQTLKREQGEIQVSAFDLNIEQGRIEQPQKPTIRFATPIFDDKGQRRGIVILNFLGTPMLDHLDRLSPDAISGFLLANEAGKWLLSPKPEDAWSLMDETGESRGLEQGFPVLWTYLQGRDTGQRYTANGLLTFRKVRLSATQAESQEAALFGLDSWIIISRVSPPILKARFKDFLVGILLVYAMVLVLLFCFSLVLARAWIRKKKEMEERGLAEKRLRISLQEKEVLLKELHHRVKNNLQVISSLLKLQSRYVQDPSSRVMFQESLNRVQAISTLHEILYRSDDLANISTKDYLQSLLENLFASYGVDGGRISSTVHVTDISLPVDRCISCGLIINELISNSLKHAFPQNRKGTLQLSLDRLDSDNLQLLIGDDGIGLSQPPDLATSKSMGLRLVRFMVEELGGSIQLDGSAGTTYRIQFPESKK